MAKVLVIDDDRMMCEMLSDIGESMGHAVEYSFTIREGMELALEGEFDVVFLDVRLPDGNGLYVLPRIRETASSPEVIIITAAGDPNGAELAIKSGAWDYLEKPPSLDAIKLALIRALDFRRQKKLSRSRRSEGKGIIALKREAIIGNSQRLKVCLDLLAQAAGSEVNALITGETGTGKELFARAVHENSSRAAKAFVVVDCAALTETLVESVLFGHERGAFTGADRARDGMVKQADGGTLFLDEVGELPESIQKAFLRVLQERGFRPVGGKHEVQSNFRLIAATNRDLERMVQEGRFRKDLFFRIRSLAIVLPPLRGHASDIKEIAMHYMARQCERYGTDMKGFSQEFIHALAAYNWPGNVRELVHTMETVLIAANDNHESVLYPHHLPVHIRAQVARASISRKTPEGEDSAEADTSAGYLPSLRDFREFRTAQIEKEYLQRLVSLCGTDIKEACRVSGLSRSHLYALLKKHAMIMGMGR